MEAREREQLLASRYAMASKDARLREASFPGETTLAVVVWFFSWWALFQLLYGSLAPYMLATSLAIHVRFRPPMGQIPPMPDPLLIFVRACLLLLATLCAITPIFGHYAKLGMPLVSMIWWTLASCSFLVAAWRREQESRRLREVLKLKLPAQVPMVNRPVVAKLHGYAYALFNKLPGSHVHVHRMECGADLDIWLQNTIDTKKLHPVMIFMHGGGWKGGGARMSHHVHLLHFLANQGWFVVSVAYRKKRWPEQLTDSIAALEWVRSEEAAKLGADATNISVMGSSAGGHLACLVILRAIELNIKIKAAALFYPALDPGDLTRATATSPISLWPLRIRYGQSLLQWFFETFILGCDAEKWDSASVLTRLRPETCAPEVWPPTLVIHGLSDSVVPIEHSWNFLRLLQSLAAPPDTDPNSVPYRTSDLLVEIPQGRHTFDIVGTEDNTLIFAGVATWLDEHSS